LKSIFADYFDDWFIPFVGDDLVAKYISNVKNTKLHSTYKNAQISA